MIDIKWWIDDNELDQTPLVHIENSIIRVQST